MALRLRCYTLFDITRTGINSRAKAPTENNADWLNKRNSQCNFDTILQVISMRSQPEISNDPRKIALEPQKTNIFGTMYSKERNLNAWIFDFEVQHASVFENDKSNIGSLYTDCEGVPMIKTKDTLDTLPVFLDIGPELKNIHFEII